jgi:hypothetical protein
MMVDLFIFGLFALPLVKLVLLMLASVNVVEAIKNLANGDK